MAFHWDRGWDYTFVNLNLSDVLYPECFWYWRVKAIPECFCTFSTKVSHRVPVFKHWEQVFVLCILSVFNLHIIWQNSYQIVKYQKKRPSLCYCLNAFLSHSSNFHVKHISKICFTFCLVFFLSDMAAIPCELIVILNYFAFVSSYHCTHFPDI